jgi:hypothetical protein
MAPGAVDVHQHLWPEQFVDALRRRKLPPRLAGSTLQLPGEPDFRLDLAAHDLARRAEVVRADRVDLALVSLSSPLGVEWLPADEAAPLLAAYHEGVLAFPDPFGAWAAAGVSEPDPVACEKELDRGCVGLQLPATALLDGAGYDRVGPLLDLLAARDQPLLVHPGPAAPTAAPVPPWWPAVVSYVQQMHAAWYAFGAHGRSRYPGLRVCFAMLAGLAPVHGERFTARGGGRRIVDGDAYLETSSYGPRGIDAVVRELGIDVIVHGSDRPYAEPADPRLGAAAAHAIRCTNPHRLLGT